MLFWDMYNKPPDKIKRGDTFSPKFIIFMGCIVKGYRFSIIGINTGGCYDRSSQITADIFDGSIRRTGIRFGSDIKAILMFFIDFIFDFLKGRANKFRHAFKKDFAEGIAEECVIKMLNIAPRSKVAGTAFRNQGMNMGVPFEIAAEGMKDTDKAGGEIF